MNLHSVFSLYRKWDCLEVDKWKVHESKGMHRFVIVEGILKWGVTSLACFLILSHQGITLKNDEPLLHIFLTSIVWMICAICYGLLSWYATKQSYKFHIGESTIEK